jgi:hypothetical protein
VADEDLKKAPENDEQGKRGGETNIVMTEKRLNGEAGGGDDWIQSRNDKTGGEDFQGKRVVTMDPEPMAVDLGEFGAQGFAIAQGIRGYEEGFFLREAGLDKALDFVAEVAFQFVERDGGFDASGEHLLAPGEDGLFEIEHRLVF